MDTNQDTRTDTQSSGPKALRSMQAERVFDLFAGIDVGGRRYKSGAGGAAAALKAIGAPYTRSAVYKWGWPKSRSGTDGIIPNKAIRWIEKAARSYGILIPPGTLDPRANLLRDQFGKALLE